MNQAPSTIEDLLVRARAGDREVLGELLERHRAWLKILAKRQLGGALGARVDESDLVQQTCLSAVRSFETFEGDGEAEFLGWLKQIQKHTACNLLRDHRDVQKRDLAREQPLVDFSDLAQSASPSQRLMLSEEALRLAIAMEALPEDQAEAVRLRHLEGFSLAQIAEQMGRSDGSIVGLLKRGMQNLRKHLPSET